MEVAEYFHGSLAAKNRCVQAATPVKKLKNHFSSLDGLRGVAAIAVMFFHLTNERWFSSGFLAVDFFFVLSGFVIGFSYEARIRSGLSAKSFSRIRLIRLYPMLLFSELVGLVSGIQYFGHQAFYISPANYIGVFVSGMFLLPNYLFADFGHEAFPLNGPSWSLFYEFIANLLFVLGFARLPWSVLVAIMLAGVISMWFVGGIDSGSDVWNLQLGFLRVVAGFVAGLLLFRLYQSPYWPNFRCPFSFLSCFLLSLFFLPHDIEGYFFLPLLLVMALIVIFGTNDGTSGSLAVDFLGEISYPLYLLHRPVFFILESVFSKLGVDVQHHQLLTAMLLSVPTVLVAYLASRLYDMPVRKALNKRFLAGNQIPGRGKAVSE